MGKESQPG